MHLDDLVFRPNLHNMEITDVFNLLRKYNKKLRKTIYKDGTIVLIRRSKKYIAGHYLIRYKGLWMDPWINLTVDNNILQAESGFRRRLPGSPSYAIFPEID